MAQLGFVGLGAMGQGIARNIATKLHQEGKSQLLVYNRTHGKAQQLASEPGAHCRAASCLAEVASSCDLIFMILSDDDATISVLEQMFSIQQHMQSSSSPAELPAGAKVVVSLSTNQPSMTAAAERALAHAEVAYISSPVFGRPDAAAAAQLLVCPAGCAAGKQATLPYLQAIGRAVLDVGPVAQASSALKLKGNFMLVSSIEMLAEAMALGDKAGVSRQQLLQLIDAFFPAPPLQGYARRMAADDFSAGAGFTVDLGLKDVKYMRQLAEGCACPLPLADLVHGHLLAAKADGRGGQDWSAAATAVRRAAGLAPDGAGAAAGAAAAGGGQS